MCVFLFGAWGPLSFLGPTLEHHPGAPPRPVVPQDAEHSHYNMLPIRSVQEYQ